MAPRARAERVVRSRGPRGNADRVWEPPRGAASYDGGMSDRPAAPASARPHRTPAWVPGAILWQVYPLGFCGAPPRREDLEAIRYGEAGENVVHRLGRITGWLDHLVSLGANVLLLNPVFDSVTHGYDTLDHHRIDPRLGSEQDWDQLVAACRERGIRIVLDGVFNHVSDHHPVVRRALAEGPDSEAGARIRWAGDHPYGFEGNADLVELNLRDQTVQDAIVEVMGYWLDRGADGWRLDAMYAAGPEVWAPILARVHAEHPDAWIHGEVLHGEHPQILAASGADGLTQYELWKAIWSSLKDGNLYELAHALGRHEEFMTAPQDAPDPRRLPVTFLGNHDTTRIASQLPDGRDLAVAIALLALLPGVPSIYSGDELGAVGVKEDRPGGDDAIRPVFPDDPARAADVLPVLSPAAAPRILEAHRRLLGLRRRLPWLASAHVRVEEGSLSNTSARIVIEADDGTGRALPDDSSGERIVLAINLADAPQEAGGEVIESLSGADMLDGVGPAAPGMIPAHGAAVLR